uniref:Uncharacterized protein n=1 Tax=Rhizophora mucronata TaxID=61149 RepID=A0A2P2NGJ0_RHIMU
MAVLSFLRILVLNYRLTILFMCIGYELFLL